MPAPRVAAVSRALFFAGVEVAPDDVIDPTFQSSEVGDVTNLTVVVVFSEQIVSPGDDYAAGVTIEVDGGAATINSATLQGDNQTVYYVVAASPDMNDVVTWAYSAAGGDIEDLVGNALEDVAAQAVTNNVGEHWRFDHLENANQALLMGYD
jgi:hypothetical protein